MAQKANYMMALDWKDGLSLDLASVDAWMRKNAGPDYCGNQAHARLELWFLNEPSQDIKDEIQEYWDGLSKKSAEAKAYKSADDRKADVAAKAASGKAKLKALGLSDDEVEALLG